MSAYYNEHEPYAAQWLRNLITAGHIAPGDVDERDIQDVQPDDLRGYTQCHFFAGIGGWSYALRLAGWPDDRPVWTGSCPCQAFSLAGKRLGGSDPRHLWPSWYRLIAERAPAIIFGEQVESAIAHGWLDLVAGDLEQCAYAVGASVLPAAGVGASHRRSRLWFVAHAHGDRSQGLAAWDTRRQAGAQAGRSVGGALVSPGVAFPHVREWALIGADGRVGRQEQISWYGHRAVAPEPFVRSGHHGISGRMGQLRAYGNAIVPQVAAEFIAAADEAMTSHARQA